MQTETTATITVLNDLLRGEISAVETYDQAIERLLAGSIGQDGWDSRRVSISLERCRDSHAHRVAQLKGAIQDRGGRPKTTSGVWGAFAKLLERGATWLGPEPAIFVLQEGEDHGLKQYRKNLDNLDLMGRVFVLEELLPEQAGTHHQITDLKNSVTAELDDEF